MSQTIKKLRIGIEKLKRSSKPLMIHSIDKSQRLKNNQDNLRYLEAITNLGALVIEAREKQDSVTLQQMARDISEIAFYVNSLQLERETLYLNQ